MSNHLVTDYVLAGALATLAALLFGLRRVLAHRAISVLLGAWFFAALGSTWSGFYQGQSSRVPTIQYGLLIPIVAGILLFRWWKALRQTVESVPQAWIVTIQVYRVLGAIFLILYAAGRMPGEFAWPAGVGDILVGLLAPVVAIAYARRLPGSTVLLWAWNLFGIADLVEAAILGFLTSPSPLQRLAFDRPNTLISSFPLALIPVFLVPLSVLLHLASLAKLRRTPTIPGPLAPRDRRLHPSYSDDR
jgi:hypothetical protein